MRKVRIGEIDQPFILLNANRTRLSDYKRNIVRENYPFYTFELVEEGKVKPALVIGAPVGFVNVVESKEMTMETMERHGIPYIVPKGRKGGSNIAATICNSMIYYKG